MKIVHRYPALYLAMAVGAGIALGGLIQAYPIYVGLLVGGASLVGIGSIQFVFRTRLLTLSALWGTGLLIAAGIGFGTTARLLALHYVPANELALLLTAEETAAEVVGVVQTPPRVSSYQVQVTLGVDSVRIAGRWHRVSGKVRLSAREAMPPVSAGQSLRVQAALSVPAPRRNPEDFSYRDVLARQGIRVAGTTLPGTPWVVLAPPSGMATLLEPLRKRIAEGLKAHVVGEEARGILQALLAGDRDGLDPERRALLARTGLAHLLAVSGLHVLLVGLLLYQFLGPLLTRMGWPWRVAETTRGLLTLGVLGGYTLLVGAGPSVLRALTMAVAMLMGHVLQRPTYPINSLALAAVLVLFFDPSSLFDVGFQLSFAAVAAIVLWAPGWQALLPEALTRRRVWRWFVEMMLVSLAATLGTAPVMMYHFGQVALAGILLNIPSIPAASLALAAGLLTVVVHPVAPAVANLFGAVAEIAAETVMRVASVGDVFLPWMNLSVYLRAPLLLLAVVCVLGALQASIVVRWRWRLLLVMLVLVTSHIMSGGLQPRRMSVLYFDVGQGDAALVTFPNGRTLLVDGGPASPYVNEGERTLLPHVQRAGIRRIDMLLITHPHLDHLGGATAVLEALPVGRLVISGSHREVELARELEAVARRHEVPVIVPKAGDTLAIDPTVHLLVLSPDDGLRRHEDPNEASVVVRLQYGATRFLFMGDAEAEAEARMVTRWASLLEADVVKVGHHGSRTSSTPVFVQRVARRASGLAILSVARKNRYGLPDEDVWARWEAYGFTVLPTFHHGALWLESDGERIRQIPWRDS